MWLRLLPRASLLTANLCAPCTDASPHPLKDPISSQGWFQQGDAVLFGPIVECLLAHESSPWWTTHSSIFKHTQFAKASPMLWTSRWCEEGLTVIGSKKGAIRRASRKAEGTTSPVCLHRLSFPPGVWPFVAAVNSSWHSGIHFTTGEIHIYNFYTTGISRESSFSHIRSGMESPSRPFSSKYERKLQGKLGFATVSAELTPCVRDEKSLQVECVHLKELQEFENWGKKRNKKDSPRSMQSFDLQFYIPFRGGGWNPLVSLFFALQLPVKLHSIRTEILTNKFILDYYRMSHMLLQ